VYAIIGASVTVAGGFIAAWLLAQRRGTSSRVLDFLGNYHFGVGMAQSVLAAAVAMLAVVVVLGGYRLLAPAGWRRIGGARSG